MSTTFANKIDNLDIYAKRAECDAAGNTLSTTYATKSELPGSSQLVPSATSADADKVLTVDSLGVPGWAIVPSQSTGLFQATYGTSTYNEVRAAVNANKIVYCSVSGRMAFLAYISSNNYEFQYYRSNGSSSGTDSVFVYKVSSSGWETTERPVKAGNISYPVTQVNVNGSSAMTGTVANITVQAVPAVTSSDNNKVLKASYSGGTGSYSWQTESGGGGTQADWTESDQADPSYIQNKPTIVGIAAGSNVSITEENNTLTVAATDTTYTAGTGISISNGAISNSDPLPAHTSTESGKVLGVDSNGDLGWVNQSGGGGGSYSAGTGIDITAGTISVDTTTVAMKTDIPTVPTTDQTYNSSSTNPQSGTAVAGAISGVAQVPSVTSSDNAKVLTASYSDGVASYSWQTAQGGGGTSNVTTADKQINVAVNGTGVPMQLNLLNPTVDRTVVDLGHPSVNIVQLPLQTGTPYAIELSWTFSKSLVYFPGILASDVRFQVDVANDIVLCPGSDKVGNYPEFASTPYNASVYPNTLCNAANGNVIGVFDCQQGYYAIPVVNSTYVEGVTIYDSKINAETEAISNITSFNEAEYSSASTIKFSQYIAGNKGIDESTWNVIRMDSTDLQPYADILSQNASEITLYMNSPTVNKYTSVIGSCTVTGTTPTTADSGTSDRYRYEFNAAQKALLLPGTYLVQIQGASSSGNATTTVWLYKDNNTGYESYNTASRTTYVDSWGNRTELFLMQVDENTTSIGSNNQSRTFTMVRIG